MARIGQHVDQVRDFRIETVPARIDDEIDRRIARADEFDETDGPVGAVADAADDLHRSWIILAAKAHQPAQQIGLAAAQRL